MQPPLSYLEVSGGQYPDQMIHDFDIACWLLGMLYKVTATVSCLVDPRIGELGDVDTVLGSGTPPVGLQDGVTAVVLVEAASISRAGERTVRVEVRTIGQ